MKLFLSVLGVLLSSSAALSCQTVYCYWGSWAIDRPGIGAYGVSDLPSNLCTHVVYSFLTLDAAGNVIYDPSSSAGSRTNDLAALNALKQKNKKLKTIAAIGGWNEGTADFSKVANDDTLRAKFVSNVVKFLRANNFNGLDVDWEYPTSGGNAADKEALIWLLRDLRKAFDKVKLELSIAVGVTQSKIDSSYDVVAINEYVDRIILMTYDYHGQWDKTTGAVAPLYPQLTDAATSPLNVDESVNIWLDEGACPTKILLGLAFYGRTFTLKSSSKAGTNAPAIGGGAAGKYTQEAGFYSYYEICTDQKENTAAWNIKEVEDRYVYGNKGTFWVGYENAHTIKAKGQYAQDYGLGGISIWAIDYDDFSDQCGAGSYPLLRSALEGLCGADYSDVDAGNVETPVEEPVEEPVVEEPVVEEPVVEEPVVKEPVVEKPVVEEPVVKEPVVEEPVVETPVVETPVVKEPVVEEPVVKKPVVEKPVVKEPVKDKETEEKPVVKEPVVEEPDETYTDETAVDEIDDYEDYDDDDEEDDDDEINLPIDCYYDDEEYTATLRKGKKYVVVVLINIPNSTNKKYKAVTMSNVESVKTLVSRLKIDRNSSSKVLTVPLTKEDVKEANYYD